jgi:hypothetical protein
MLRTLWFVPKNNPAIRRATYLAGILTVLLIVADCLLGRALVRQADTRDFISTPGTIISTQTADSYEKSRNPDPGMSYTYLIGTHKYLSHRDKFIWLPGDHTDDVLHDLPVGCMIEVFYDPMNPRQCVLVRGLEKADLVGATLLFLLNLFMLAYWSFPWLLMRDRKIS